MKSDPLSGPNAALGPLVVSKANRRYFAIGSNDGQVVYLTGSHLNNNFHDGMGPGADCAETPESSDYSAYLDFLKSHGHNFIRLWRWEHFKSLSPDGSFHLCMSPQPWPRTGPGVATDGKPKFDLERFDPAYYDRLRDRVIAAGNEGIYVSVMLFEGNALHLSPPPNNIEGHPFHAANNINQVGIASIVDYQVVPLERHVQALQEAHIRKVVDTLHDLPNVLYEVANESSGAKADSVQLPDGTTINTRIGDSTQWQYWVISFVKQYEAEKGYEKHPIGMTFQYPVPDQSKANDPLFNGPADWISPGFDEPLAAVKKGAGPTPGRWLMNPPASNGTKVVISDTDHYSPGKGDAVWAWKTFLRGHNPILYDFGIIDLANRPDPVSADPGLGEKLGAMIQSTVGLVGAVVGLGSGLPPYETWEPARHAMGDTLRFARKIKLIEMEPRGDLSSTGYALANPGTEYLVLQPEETSDAFTVTLVAGTYSVQWCSVSTRETVAADEVTVVSPAILSFKAPFATGGPAVLYLKQVER